MVVKQRGRVPRSIKVNEKIWNLFKKAVTERGFSTCFIMETLMQAWTTGAAAIANNYPSTSLTIKQNIEYVVDRPRRTKRLTTPLENCYQWGVWTYRKPETNEVLSKLGHVPECECNGCMPYRHSIRVAGGRELGSRTLKS